MQKSFQFVVLILAISLSVSANQAFCQEPVRTWKTTDGETLDAYWDRSNDSNPDEVCLVSNGEKYSIDVKDLCAEDQQYIQQARQKKGSKFRKIENVNNNNNYNYNNNNNNNFGSREAGSRIVKTVNGIEYAFRWCPPGAFMMGSPSSEQGHYKENQHKVTFTKGFWMLETDVTVEMYRSFTKETSYLFRGEEKAFGWTGVIELDSRFSWKNPGFTQDDNHPVVCVSWYDANAFCDWLGSKTGMTIKLPTEAQWEYACRADTTDMYPGNPDSMSWYDGASGTHPVAKKQANQWGLYDMNGNVEEWCQDWYGDYPYGSVTDPTGPYSGRSRVARGCRWDGPVEKCRSAYRSYWSPNERYFFVGFRPVALSE